VSRIPVPHHITSHREKIKLVHSVTGLP